MAYMSQEKKKALAPAIKNILREHGLRGSLKVYHHSTLVLTINSGAIDFPLTLGSADVNTYHVNSHWEGKAKDALNALVEVMNVGNHDRSDLMSDYHDVGWYVDIKIGTWEKPYVFEQSLVPA